MNPDLAVFDLDGTLVDTPRAIVRTFAGAFADMGVPAPEDAAIRATIGLPLEQAFGQLLGVPPEDERVAEGVRRYQVLFREIILPAAETLVFPGVPRGLAALRAEGFTLTIATSKFHASADALLRAAGLRDHFQVVIGADQVTRPKPHPESTELILRTLGVGADRAVVIGDTTHDLRMAHAAGVRSIAVSYGVHTVEELRSAGPTWLADSFHDVLAHLRAAAARGPAGARPVESPQPSGAHQPSGAPRPAVPAEQPT